MFDQEFERKKRVGESANEKISTQRFSFHLFFLKKKKYGFFILLLL